MIRTMLRRGPLATAFACVLAALLCAVPAVARAADTLPVYRDRVSRALSTVRDAVKTPPDAQGAADVTAKLDGLLPADDEVTDPGGTVEVSDPAMPRLLSELEGAASADDRASALSALERHLTSLDAALGRPGKAMPSDEAALRRLLAGAMEEPSASGQDVFRQWIERLVTAITDWLTGVRSTEQGAVTVLTLEIALLLVFAAAALFVIWRGVRAWRRAVARREAAPSRVDDAAVIAAAEGLPDDAAAYAERLAGEGRFREAVRALFGGAARTLSERGMVGRTRTRTNAELLADVAPAGPEVAHPLRTLSDGFEVAWYGHRDPGADGLDAARAAYREVLDAADAAASRGPVAPGGGAS